MHSYAAYSRYSCRLHASKGKGRDDEKNRYFLDRASARSPCALISVAIKYIQNATGTDGNTVYAGTVALGAVTLDFKA